MQNLQPKQQAVGQASKSMSFIEVFNTFFLELQAIFPAWRNAFPTTEHLDAAKKQWLQMFIDQSITQDKINRGLRKARFIGGDFFPSPSKFLEWTKPTLDDFGLPSIELAFKEATDNSGRVGVVHWSHKAIYHAAHQVGLSALAVMNEEKAHKAFSHAYQKTCEAVMSGQALPEIPKAIERKEPVKSSEAVANTHLANLKAMFGKPSQQPQKQDNYIDPLLANEGEAA